MLRGAKTQSWLFRTNWPVIFKNVFQTFFCSISQMFETFAKKCFALKHMPDVLKALKHFCCILHDVTASYLQAVHNNCASEML